jgi:CheY-like chemotaxis protein
MTNAKGTVLVVDDEPDIVQIVGAILEEEGYCVLKASDGVEAMERIKGQRPDVLITDRLMPRMGGIEVIRRLKESQKTKSIRVIMLTSMDKWDDVSEGYKTGADCYITKPFNKNQILNGLRLVLSARPAPTAAQLQQHGKLFLLACAALSQRTKELTAQFAAQDNLPPGRWVYKGLEDRLIADRTRTGQLKTAPEWQFAFEGWGVTFENAKSGEHIELAIGPGGRCDSFDEWRVQCYIEDLARRENKFGDLKKLIDDHSGVVQSFLQHSADQGWIEPATSGAEQGTEEIDAELTDRWAVTQKGWEVLQQS